MKIKLLLIFFILSSLPAFAQYNSIWDSVTEEVRNTNAFKRYEWFYRTRTDEFGNFPKEHVDRQFAGELAKIEQQKLFKTNTTSDQWTNIGPKSINMSNSFIPYWGNVSGRVRGLDVHPSNPDIVYIGAAAGGIWKTTDGGATWTDKSGDLSRLTFGSVAIDPNNTDVIYAGTGETRWLFNNVTFEGDGLYKSTNGGDNWTKITNGFGTVTQFGDIEVNPGNSNIILAALGSGNWNNQSISNEGIWRSSDAGLTWTKTLNVPDGFDVAFHPTNSSLAYAASGNLSSSGGFHISTDGGVTWTQSNTGLPDPTIIGRIQFDISASSPNTIYTLVYSSNTINGFRTAAYKSTDGGVNWSAISSGVNISGSYNGTAVNDQGSYDLCLSVHPTNPNIVSFGNVETSRTTDGSTISFVRKPDGYISTGGSLGAWANYTHTDIHKIQYAPSNGNIAYIGCDGGVYKSNDAGATWSSVNTNINTIQFYRLASHPTNSSILFGGAQDNGNFSTSDKGVTNWVFETSGDGMECFIDYNDPNYIFMSTQNGYLMRSIDAGVSWLGIGSTANSAWVSPYWQHPTDFNKIYAAIGLRIYRSSDRGANWPTLSAVFASNPITSVAQSSVNVNKMIAVASYYTTTPDIYNSTDEGVTWTSITTNFTNAGFTGTNIQRVVADPVAENTYYITRASYTSGQVIKTTDFGSTWTDASGNLPTISVNDLFIDPDNTNHLYAANDFGVYWTNDGGTNWSKLSNGMPFVPVLDFSFFDNGAIRLLRAASHGRGIYELQIDTPLPVELTSFFARSEETSVFLNWETATEINNYGFEIERSLDKGEFEKIGFIEGNGNSNSPKQYSFTDKYVNGIISYRLKQIDFDGDFTYSDIINVESPTIADYKIYQNYPNPFNPITIIKYKLAEVSNVKLVIINALGERISSLLNEQQNKGIFEVTWDGSNYASGIYFANLQVNSIDGKSNYNKTIKMILNK